MTITTAQLSCHRCHHVAAGKVQERAGENKREGEGGAMGARVSVKAGRRVDVHGKDEGRVCMCASGEVVR
jgi:hypothetical protein